MTAPTNPPQMPALARKRLAKRLERLARRMDKVGVEMVYWGERGELGRHGHELLGAAAMASGWAKEIGSE